MPSHPASFEFIEGPQSGGRRSWRRNLSCMCGLTSSFWKTVLTLIQYREACPGSHKNSIQKPVPDHINTTHRNLSWVCGLTSTFCKKMITWKLYSGKYPQIAMPWTIVDYRCLGSYIPAPQASPGKEPVSEARCRFCPWTSSQLEFHWKAIMVNKVGEVILTSRTTVKHERVLQSSEWSPTW